MTEKMITHSMEQRAFLISNSSKLPIETSSDNSSGYITVIGRWMYQDIDGSWKPIRFATVKLYDAEPLLDELVAINSTDENGYYYFHVDNDDGPLQDGRDVYVKIECESPQAKVTDGNILNIPYWSVTDTHSDVPDGVVDMGTYYLPYDNYQALDYIIDEYQWLESRVGWTRPQVLVRWPYED